MSFFSLPREIRDEIYSVVFLHDASEDQPKLHVRGYAGTPEMPLPPYMVLCRQFYNEALPYYVKSVQLALADIAPLSYVKQALVTIASRVVLENIQAVEFANIEPFRTESAYHEWMKWDRQQDMPWRPVHERGQIIYFTGLTASSDDGANMEATFSPAIAFLHIFPRLRRVEMSTMTCKCAPDREGWRGCHYYDLLSLSTLQKLESVQINFRLGGIRRKLYRNVIRRGEDRMRRQDRIIKERLDDGMGLISWLQEGLQKAGKTVDVRGCCVCIDRKLERADICYAREDLGSVQAI